MPTARQGEDSEGVSFGFAAGGLRENSMIALIYIRNLGYVHSGIMSLTLYYHPLASYCWKVLIALYENGTEFDKRLINLGDAAERSELALIWPITKFPVIRDHTHQRDVAETSIIIEYLDRIWRGARPLIPDEWAQALEVRLWDRIFDHYVQAPMQQIVADRMQGTTLDLSKERTLLTTTYRMLDQHLASRTWISKSGFSMAECAAAPALFYAGTVQPLPAELTNLKGYYARLLERASVQRVIAEAKPYFQYYPFAEQLPERFR
jgi:glutathione S-transferase